MLRGSPAMHRGVQCALFAITAAIVLAPACSRDPSPGTLAATAEGDRLMRRMSDALARTPAFRFETAESLDQIGTSAGERILRFTRVVTVRRPDALFFEVDGSGDTALDVSAYYDGKTVSLRDNAHGVWAQTTVPGTLDEMLDDVAQRYSLPVPIADVIYKVPYDAFIGRNSKGGFVGRETIDGVKCARLSYGDEFVDVQVWVPSTGQPLPRRVQLVYKKAPGAPSARIDFTRWDLDPKIADGLFTFKPDEGTTPIAFEQFVAGLLSAGDPASLGAPPTTGVTPSR